MGELKTLRKENLKLKEDLAAVSDEVQSLKTLLKQQRLQSEIECVGEPTKTYVAGIQKSVDFLSEDHHNAKEFREKTLQELGKLSHKLAAISSKADNMAAAIGSNSQKGPTILVSNAGKNSPLPPFQCWGKNS